MRIAITGASGTGKTTLARAISERFDLPLNPVGARSVAAAMGFQNPYDVDKAGRRVEFQKRLFEEKLAWEAEHDRFVTDRSYLDNLTYCCLHMPEDLEPGQMDRFMGAMERYDLVLGLPSSGFQDLSDGIRKTNTEYQALYERLLTSFCIEASDDGYISALRRIGGPLNNRTERSLEAVGGFFHD